MKVLIIGASGFVGGVLYRELSSANRYTVIGTYNSQKSEHFLSLDVLNKEAVATLTSHLKPDVVIWSISDMQNECALTNIGIENLLSSIDEHCAFIYFSTNVFGGGRGG